MTNAIATQLHSITNADTDSIQVTDASAYWQEKIAQVVTDSTASTYLVFSAGNRDYCSYS